MNQHKIARKLRSEGTSSSMKTQTGRPTDMWVVLEAMPFSRHSVECQAAHDHQRAQATWCVPLLGLSTEVWPRLAGALALFFVCFVFILIQDLDWKGQCVCAWSISCRHQQGTTAQIPEHSATASMYITVQIAPSLYPSLRCLATTMWQRSALKTWGDPHALASQELRL